MKTHLSGSVGEGDLARRASHPFLMVYRREPGEASRLLLHWMVEILRNESTRVSCISVFGYPGGAKFAFSLLLTLSTPTTGSCGLGEVFRLLFPLNGRVLWGTGKEWWGWMSETEQGELGVSKQCTCTSICGNSSSLDHWGIEFSGRVMYLYLNQWWKWKLGKVDGMERVEEN